MFIREAEQQMYRYTRISRRVTFGFQMLWYLNWYSHMKPLLMFYLQSSNICISLEYWNHQ